MWVRVPPSPPYGEVAKVVNAPGSKKEPVNIELRIPTATRKNFDCNSNATVYPVEPRLGSANIFLVHQTATLI